MRRSNEYVFNKFLINIIINSEKYESFADLPLLRKPWLSGVCVCFMSAGDRVHDMIVNEAALLKTYGNLLKANESYDESIHFKHSIFAFFFFQFL